MLLAFDTVARNMEFEADVQLSHKTPIVWFFNSLFHSLLLFLNSHHHSHLFGRDLDCRVYFTSCRSAPHCPPSYRRQANCLPTLQGKRKLTLLCPNQLHHHPEPTSPYTFIPAAMIIPLDYWANVIHLLICTNQKLYRVTQKKCIIRILTTNLF